VLCFHYFRDNCIVTWGSSGFFDVIFVWGLVDPTHKIVVTFPVGQHGFRKMFIFYTTYICLHHNTHKKKNKQLNKRSMAGTIKEEIKRGGQRKAKRQTTHRN
jgi:hypothetical protein